jgi:hypothetical protein
LINGIATMLLPEQTAAAYPHKDQRIFQRSLARFPTRFKDTRTDFGTHVSLRDVSAGGAKIVTRERVYLCDRLTLEVKVPDRPLPIHLRGEVIWVKKSTFGFWEAGLKFPKAQFLPLRQFFT